MRKRKKGTFFGVSLGVGHIMNVTVLALRVLNTVKNVCVPISLPGKKSEALSRLEKMPVHLEDKNIVEVYLPMKKGDLTQYWINGAEKIQSFLEKGEDVAFAGIGDLLHYGTFFYLENILKNKGFNTIYIPGITSYQALAENLNIPLVQGKESLLVMPDDNVELKHINSFDTIVFLKKPANKELFKELNRTHTLYLGMNLGMRGERFGEVDNVEDDIGNLPYFSLIIAKKRG